MKKLALLMIIIGSAMIIVSSCSIQKRLYNPGYYVDFASNKKHLSATDQTITIMQGKQEFVQYDKPTISIKQKSVVSPKSGSYFYASEKMADSKKIKSPASKIKSIAQQVKAVKQLRKSVMMEGGDGSGALRAIGWVIVIIGIIFILVISIGIGAVLMLLGLVFVIAGRKHPERQQNNTSQQQVQNHDQNQSNNQNTYHQNQNNNHNANSGEWMDVVYLKNGGMVRGMIIEQVPNVQVKVQTKDGNIFVYKMDEIEKITKEQVK